MRPTKKNNRFTRALLRGLRGVGMFFCALAFLLFWGGSPQAESDMEAETTSAPSAPVQSSASVEASKEISKEISKEAPKVPPSVHPWGGFEQGAWRLSRTIVEKKLGPTAQNRTSTESRLTLQDKTARNITLMQETQVTLMGKSVQIEPEQLKQDFLGLSAGTVKRYESLPSETLQVGGLPVVCHVVRITLEKDKTRRTVTLWYDFTREPYIFRRTTQIFDATTKQRKESLEMNVTALNVRTVFLGKVLKAYQYTQETTTNGCVSRECTVASTQIPGGIVTRQVQDFDAKGELLQNVTVELLDYGRTATEHQRNAYHAGTSPSRRLPFLPQAMEKAEAQPNIQVTEFSVEFTKKEEPDSLPEEVWEPGGFRRFKDRWRQTRQRVARETGLVLIPLPEVEEVPVRDARSPLYATASRQEGTSDRAIISTETLRSAASPQNYPSRPPLITEMEQRMEQARRNWRQKMQFFWGF